MACATCHKVYVYSEDDVLDSDARPHVCKTCGLSFSLKIQLKRHTLLHSNGSSYVCVNCSKDHHKDSDKSYNLRLTKTSDYVCLVCNESFKTKRLLIKHTNNEHSIKTSYECPVCFESFDSTSDLKKHSSVHNTIVNKRKRKKPEADDLDDYVPPPAVEITESSKSIPQKKLFCTNCTRSFAYEGSFEKHIKKCVEESQHSQKVSERKKAKIPDFDKTDKKYECNVCGQGFDRKKALDGHELTHLMNEENSSNDGFSDDGSDSEEFVPPKKQKQSKSMIIKQSFMCDSCNFVCFSKATLMKHKLNHKSNLDDDKKVKEGNHKCPDCQEEFILADELWEHKLVPCTKRKEKKAKCENSGQKKKNVYKCEVCEKQFLTNKLLKQHLILHKTDDSEKSASLEKVEKSVSDNDNNVEFSDDEDLSLVKVIKHRSKKFSCNLCGKRFAGETCLRKHIERHSTRDEKQSSKSSSPRAEKCKRTKKSKILQTLICEYCQEEFTGKRGAYIKHIHSHTPEVCGICDERFVDRQGLREHCKIHVGTEEGRMFMECSQKALDAKNGVTPPEPKVEYIYLVLP